jgi:hypothetical protein
LDLNREYPELCPKFQTYIDYRGDRYHSLMNAFYAQKCGESKRKQAFIVQSGAEYAVYRANDASGIGCSIPCTEAWNIEKAGILKEIVEKWIPEDDNNQRVRGLLSTGAKRLSWHSTTYRCELTQNQLFVNTLMARRAYLQNLHLDLAWAYANQGRTDEEAEVFKQDIIKAWKRRGIVNGLLHPTSVMGHPRWANDITNATVSTFSIDMFPPSGSAFTRRAMRVNPRPSAVQVRHPAVEVNIRNTAGETLSGAVIEEVRRWPFSTSTRGSVFTDHFGQEHSLEANRWYPLATGENPTVGTALQPQVDGVHGDVEANTDGGVWVPLQEDEDAL